MNSGNMFIQISFIVGCIVTERARKWLFACMSSNMSVQVRFITSSMLTKRTLEWFLIDMNSNMFDNVLFVAFFITCCTSIRIRSKFDELKKGK